MGHDTSLTLFMLGLVFLIAVSRALSWSLTELPFGLPEVDSFFVDGGWLDVYFPLIARESTPLVPLLGSFFEL
jgi:hypothetical protein